MDLHIAKKNMVKYSNRIWQKEWVANHDGNLTYKLSKNRFLATPTSETKADLKEKDLIILDASGKKIEGKGNPFSEVALHYAIYNSRPDINSVIHAHPPYASAWGITGLEPPPFAIAEMIVSLGEKVPLLPFYMPKSAEWVNSVSENAGLFNGLLLSANGALSYGSGLEQAYLRMELIEHWCKISSIANNIGTIKPLEDSCIKTLLSARKKAGLEPSFSDSSKELVISNNKINSNSDLSEIVKQEVLKALKKL